MNPCCTTDRAEINVIQILFFFAWMMPSKTKYLLYSKHPPEWKLTTVSVKVEATLVGVFITSLWWDLHVVIDTPWTALSH